MAPKKVYVEGRLQSSQVRPAAWDHVKMLRRHEIKKWLPWEFGSGNVSLATKCITVVFPWGSFNAARHTHKVMTGAVLSIIEQCNRKYINQILFRPLFSA